MITKSIWALARFSLAASLFLTSTDSSIGDDWPQWIGPHRDAEWRESGILKVFPPDGPPVRWRTPIGTGYSGPAVADGRVYITDRKLAPKASNPANPFERGKILGFERVLCLDAQKGQILWQHEYDCPYDVSYPAGPRATPLVDESRVYTLGTEGDLFCFDTAQGNVLWSRQFKKEYDVSSPMWGFAAHPLLDGDKLICLARGQGSTVVAFDKISGKELWRALSASEPGYCPPMIYELAGRRQLIVWHPGSINGLDPETGRVYWSFPFKIRAGLTIATPRQQADRLFVTAFYNSARMLRMTGGDPPGVTLDWAGQGRNERNTASLHSIISTPFWEGDYIYGVCSYGQLRCLNAKDGSRVWETLEATGGQETRWANAFIVKHESRFFLANEQGDLIIAKMTPAGYDELSRTHLLEPTNSDPGRPVVWSHPAFAYRCVFARNDQELICVSLAAAD